jgi:hypothetical protein
MVCAFDNSTCGSNPDPSLAKDPELDPRFSANSNFIIARTNAQQIATGPSLTTNSHCTYIIKKSFSKVGLSFQVL